MATEMTPRERVIAALERRQPDRVPYFEWVIDPHVIRAVDPEWDYETCVEEMGLDAVGANVTFDSTAIRWVDEETRTFRDRWGVLMRYTTEVAAFPVSGPIKSESDLRSFTSPDPATDGMIPMIKEVIDKNKGHRAVFFSGREGWIHAAYLLDMDELLIDLHLKPQLVHDVMDMVVAYYDKVMVEAIKLGVDIIVIGDDYAHKSGPLMSPAHYREFCFPRLKHVVELAHEMGAYVVKHSDGNLNPILDMIVETGVDCINPLEPTAGMDIAKIKAEYGDRVCVMGNVDCAQLLTYGTPEEVRAETRECIRVAAPGGGHILGCSNSIHSAVRPENFVALVQAAHEFGRYPINIPAPPGPVTRYSVFDWHDI